MNELETGLFKTRKSVLDVCREFGIQYPPDSEISLKECVSCGIWLTHMLEDLDKNLICVYCYDSYGP